MAGRLPEAQVVHVLPGRLRLKVPERRGDGAFFARARDLLARQSGVAAVAVNPRTASVLIEHAPQIDPPALKRYAATHQVLRLVIPEPGSGTAAARAGQGLVALDTRLQDMSRGGVDTESMILAALVIMGLVQLSRGEVLAPAATLLWYAFEIMGRRARGNSKE